MPRPVLRQDDLVLILRQLWCVDHVQEVAVHYQGVVQRHAVTDWTFPGGLLLVHLDEEVRVEAL